MKTSRRKLLFSSQTLCSKPFEYIPTLDMCGYVYSFDYSHIIFMRVLGTSTLHSHHNMREYKLVRLKANVNTPFLFHATYLFPENVEGIYIFSM